MRNRVHTHAAGHGRHTTLRTVVCYLLVVSMVAPMVATAQPVATPRISATDSPASAAQPPPPAAPRVVPPSVSSAVRLMPGPDYRLGSGDLLDVQIAGRVEVIRQQVMVDLDRSVTIPPLAPVEVGGLTLLAAHRRLTDAARAMFRFADVTVSVIAPRVFEVVVAGEVERPDSLIVSATRRVHDVILAAGGITPRGSLRRVRVDQQGAARELDLLRFQLLGDLRDNPFVEEGMRIHVPARGPTVSLTGAVVRPGEYELGPRGSLSELLDLTGGLAQHAAAAESRLTRIGPDGVKTTSSLDLVADAGRDVRLQAADAVFVPSVGVLQDVVEVRGAFTVTAEGGKTTTAGKPTIVQRLELARGERVRDVVQKAGGLAPYADLRLAYVERGLNAGPRQRIPVDLQRLLVEKDETQNIQLENGDLLAVPVVEDRVYVVGEVKTPGPIDFRQDLTPREYVTMAGGPTARAKVAATTVTFRSGRTFAMSEAPPLEPGAVVTVPEVAIKWWQDYVMIAQVIGSLITAYTGIWVLFNGPLTSNNGN